MQTTKEAPFLNWFFSSFFLVLRFPKDFFSVQPLEHFNQRAIWLACVCAFVGCAGQAATQLCFVNWASHSIPTDPLWLKQISQMLAEPTANLADSLQTQLKILQTQTMFELLFLPLTTYFTCYVLAGILHVTLHGLSKTPAKPVGFDTTLMIVAFAMAPQIFSAVPVLGPPISALWMIGVLIIGLRQAYSIRVFSAFTLVIAPALLVKVLWTSSIQSLAVYWSKVL